MRAGLCAGAAATGVSPSLAASAAGAASATRGSTATAGLAAGFAAEADVRAPRMGLGAGAAGSSTAIASGSLACSWEAFATAERACSRASASALEGRPRLRFGCSTSGASSEASGASSAGAEEVAGVDLGVSWVDSSAEEDLRGRPGLRLTLVVSATVTACWSRIS